MEIMMLMSGQDMDSLWLCGLSTIKYDPSVWKGKEMLTNQIFSSYSSVWLNAPKDQNFFLWKVGEKNKKINEKSNEYYTIHGK